MAAVEDEIAAGKFNFSRAQRHPHERRAGSEEADRRAAGRLHTARSRNDQVATDFRLYVRDAIDTFIVQLKADGAGGSRRGGSRPIMPGFTHLQARSR